ncbi:hypothetical protein [Aquimarina rubra]|uniref:Uncharacterized protein n=1 Tax=Aquimarina rubra TaxID=1920033 RepID=A0ABW5LEI7_9FLAO
MKNIICLIILSSFIIVNGYSQKEGQSFCGGDVTGSYFPLSVKKKKLVWGNTFYFETKKEEKVIDGKKYIKYEQAWENGQKVEMLLREELGTVFQYEPDGSDETLRYNSLHKAGDSWLTSDKEAKYTIVSYDGKLATPYCKYKKLMVLEGKFKENTFLFYYLKGYGYVGATLEDELISFATPEW